MLRSMAGVHRAAHICNVELPGQWHGLGIKLGAAGKTDPHCALPVDDEPVRGALLLPLLLLLRAGGTGSSVSGRYGTTPGPPRPVSMMILLVSLRMRSIVSRYIRSRVTAGAFLYCA